MVSIKEFMELREAGYSVDQIREYSDFLENKPEAAPAPADPAQPAQPVPAAPAQGPLPAPQLSPDQVNDNRDILQTILSTIRGMNINRSDMPAPSERNAQDILAEIINPKEGK